MINSPQSSPEKMPDPPKPQEKLDQKGAAQTMPSKTDKPTGKKEGTLDWIITKDSKFGRANRSVIRSLGWLVSLFALGFLTVYILFYIPLAQEHEKLTKSYDDTQIQLQTVKADLKTLQGANNQAKTEIVKYRLFNDTLTVNNQVLQIQMALEQHDPQGAAYSLKKLQKSLETYLPEVEQVDPDLSKLIQTRTNLVAVELSSDSKAAQLDLEAILKNLQEIQVKIGQ